MAATDGDEAAGARRRPLSRARARPHLPLGEPAHMETVQRRRILAAAAHVASEQGAAAVTVSNVLRRAGVSRRTYYELFSDRNEVLSAVLEQALTRATRAVLPAWCEQGSWAARVRGALVELLCFFDRDPVAARLLLIESAAAGPRVLERRAQVLARLAGAVAQGAGAAGARSGVPPCAADAIVGGVVSVLQVHLLASSQEPLLGLASELASIVVLPYLGATVARRELARPAPVGREVQRTAGRGPLDGGSLGDGVLDRLPIRLTHRTMQTLFAIGEHPGASNRAVGYAAGVVDQGQISKLLRRLQGVGLVRNHGGAGQDCLANAWSLSEQGQALVQALRVSGDGVPAPSPRRSSVAARR